MILQFLAGLQILHCPVVAARMLHQDAPLLLLTLSVQSQAAVKKEHLPLLLRAPQMYMHVLLQVPAHLLALLRPQPRPAHSLLPLLTIPELPRQVPLSFPRLALLQLVLASTQLLLLLLLLILLLMLWQPRVLKLLARAHLLCWFLRGGDLRLPRQLAWTVARCLAQQQQLAGETEVCERTHGFWPLDEPELATQLCLVQRLLILGEPELVTQLYLVQRLLALAVAALPPLWEEGLHSVHETAVFWAAAPFLPWLALQQQAPETAKAAEEPLEEQVCVGRRLRELSPLERGLTSMALVKLAATLACAGELGMGHHNPLQHRPRHPYPQLLSCRRVLCDA